MSQTKLSALQHPKVRGGEGRSPGCWQMRLSEGGNSGGQGEGERRGNDVEFAADAQGQAGKIRRVPAGTTRKGCMD